MFLDSFKRNDAVSNPSGLTCPLPNSPEHPAKGVKREGKGRVTFFLLVPVHKAKVAVRLFKVIMFGADPCGWAPI